MLIERQVTIRQIFTYLDRSYLMQTGAPSIKEAGVGNFRTYVCSDTKFHSKIMDGACDLLQDDRIRNGSSQDLFRDCVKMFHDLAIYTRDFEPRMLHVSQDYLKSWSEKQSTELDLPDYVDQATMLIERETARCDEFDLDASTRRALLTLLEFHLIERREEVLGVLSVNLSRDVTDALQCPESRSRICWTRTRR